LSDSHVLQGKSGGVTPGVDARKMVLRRAGLANAIFQMLAALAVFGMLYGMLDLFVPSLFGSVGLEASGTQLSQTQGWIEDAWNALPFIGIMILGIFFIARAAFESRGGI